MQLVIDISDERFRDIQRIAEVQTERKHFKTAEQIIANGIPLPKGHGKLIECHKCGFYDSEFEVCTCSSWYACPIESKKPENIKALEEYAEWASKTESEE